MLLLRSLTLLVACGSWMLMTAIADVPGEPFSEGEKLFALKIHPLIQERCLGCHGKDPADVKSSFNVGSREKLLRGGESFGTGVLTPGDAKKSSLLAMISRSEPGFEMPPKDTDKLTDEQIGWFRQWIQAGAPWPDAARFAEIYHRFAAGVTVQTSGGLNAEWTNRKYEPSDLWAYQPIERPSVPRLADDLHPPSHPIDAFALHKLRQKSIRSLAAAADKPAFIRRATLDLTGLPPTVEEMAAFLRDESPTAVDELIVRLLRSDRYGEQQARHWLDVVRYADTNGFSNDFERPSAWRYRDYVIRSFNADKPYNRFTLEQLAGDELVEFEQQVPPDTEEARELLVAVGFLRMGPWEHTGMTVAAVTRQQYLDDITHSVGVTFLGQGLRCAKCHDHKFDPVPTKDYYRLQAAFASTQFVERTVPFLSNERFRVDEVAKAAIQRNLDDAIRIIAELNEKNRQGIATYLKARGVEKFEDLPREGRVNKAEFGLTGEELSVRKVNQKRKDYFERELQRFEPLAFSVYSGPTNNYISPRPVMGVPKKLNGPAPKMYILAGGALESPTEEVAPGVLSAVYRLTDKNGSGDLDAIPTSTAGRRLALARWIASPDNPLTARVYVNRIWQQHFGRGLVSTPNNFGKMGSKPSHGELLDWLATWFIENGWSTKKLHRLIMTSDTYRQSGTRDDVAALRSVDSKNSLLAYFPSRRLAAEELRDSMLAASGELNAEMGGPGVLPEINWEIAFQPRHIMGSVAPAYQPSPTPQQRNRRTIYAFRYRTLSDPMLEIFNRPGSETSCECRDETTVTPQALALFNGEFASHRALALAAKLNANSNSLSEQIEAAFRTVLGRSATAIEVATATAHVIKMTDYHQQNPPLESKLPTSVRRHMVEEMTGEDYYWNEDLHVLKNYQRDLMPWQVKPEVRAMADLCLVLLNSNEFMYIY